MAGSTDEVKTGIGPALERARRFHGLSLEDAARTTKLRTAHLAALEAEDFDAIGSELLVRSSLQTYARYLGIDPERILDAYRRHAEVGVAGAAPPAEVRRMNEMAPVRVRDDQRLILFVAIAIVLVLLVFGLVSRGRSGSEPPPIPTQTVPPAAAAQAVASVEALRGVEIEVTIDGVSETHEMVEGETLGFEATETLRIAVPRGDAIRVTVNGEDLGVPDDAGGPWERTFQAIPAATATPVASEGTTPP